MDDNNENLKENQYPLEVEEVPEEVTAVDNLPPPVYQENKGQYLMIGVGAVIFLVILILIIKAIFGGKGVKKEVSLTYWGLWEDKEVVQPLINLYQQKNPNIKIDYQKMNSVSYREKLVVRGKAGQGPDIFRFHNTWLPEIKEVVAPLPQSIMANSEFEKTFYPVQQKDLKVGNYYYGLPLEIDGLVLVYNENLFKKAGIAAVPTTWDDITDMVPKLTVKDKTGQLITSGIALGTSSNIEHFSDIFGLLLIQNGGSITRLNSEEAAGALEIYRKFSEEPQVYWSDAMPNSLTAFIQEKVAMIIVPSWEIVTIRSANPDLNLKVLPVPAVPGGSSSSIANYWVEGVSRFSKNQIEAWKFLRFLIEKENLTKLYEMETKFRPYGEPYSRVDLASLLVQDSYIGAVIKQANNYISLPLISRTYDNGLNDEIIKYIENAVNSTIQGISYSEALKTASQGLDQVFTKYNIGQ
ncbi:hypothetical protein COY88_03795 [Candidatus Roizmanbacteria bacterium CG_4_10_14_0_8_um_filter_35_28]|uniref:Sugar ABC transporter substrate-binding protein n=2 Tax=Candidatus Roizmaniibacteriota TaxID=1752723 RepID=A0A2M8F4R2_9BACT|nr:MAG: hypothetical protein COY88_03795 [Candidatus Roizmanbacteria bacterium CG_4_10_14_0_8_um_filter_35_28]PJC34285.1 MAG: hypothetical protein CO048_00820 [Candidatus Roizmanbacteria bacterium CG_4_9_14_0_2_um_filter_35_15]